MRVTLKNGVVLEFDSTGMVEDFKECGRMAEESDYEECKDCDTCKCNLKYQGLSVCEIPEVERMLEGEK